MPLPESNRRPHGAWDNSQSTESHPPGQNIPFSFFWKLLHRELVGIGQQQKLTQKWIIGLKVKPTIIKHLKEKEETIVFHSGIHKAFLNIKQNTLKLNILNCIIIITKKFMFKRHHL